MGNVNALVACRMCAVQAIIDSSINLIMIITSDLQQSVPERAVEYIQHTGLVGVTKSCQKFPW